MLRVVVCVSGGGTNLQAIIDAVADGTITNTELVGVISNNYGVRALERAEKAGIDAKVVSPKDYENRAAFNEGPILCQNDEQTEKAISENARMDDGKAGTQSVTIRKPEKPSSRMSAVRRRPETP